jgi:hypothetical protein
MINTPNGNTDPDYERRKMIVKETVESWGFATVEAFRASRREAGLKIDPATAEVEWSLRRHLILMVSSPSRKSIDRSDRVSFRDLPEATAKALRHLCPPSFTVTAQGIRWNL